MLCFLPINNAYIKTNKKAKTLRSPLSRYYKLKVFKMERIASLTMIIAFSLLVRYLVSLGEYSGMSFFLPFSTSHVFRLSLFFCVCFFLLGFEKPPMHGDFEAQRHWMEITVNLPMEKWYFNGTSNDLMYWGLDYPPFTFFFFLSFLFFF